jgi:hypothetical protein
MDPRSWDSRIKVRKEKIASCPMEPICEATDLWRVVFETHWALLWEMVTLRIYKSVPGRIEAFML